MKLKNSLYFSNGPSEIKYVIISFEHQCKLGLLVNVTTSGLDHGLEPGPELGADGPDVGPWHPGPLL